MDGFFGIKLTFFKIATGGKFAVECVSNGMISQNCFSRHDYESL